MATTAQLQPGDIGTEEYWEKIQKYFSIILNLRGNLFLQMLKIFRLDIQPILSRAYENIDLKKWCNVYNNLELVVINLGR